MQNSTTADSQSPQQGFPMNQNFMMPAGMPFLQNQQNQNSFLLNNSFSTQNIQQFQAPSSMNNQGLLQSLAGDASSMQDSLQNPAGQQFMNMGMQQPFRQDTDWRSILSASDRNHVIRQFGAAVQNALPPPHQSQMKVENLARGLEQHIYETADSRQHYMDKIRDQLQNIERKANEVRANSAGPGASDDGINSIVASSMAQNDSSIAQQPQSAKSANDNAQQPASNSLGIDMGNNGNSTQASEAGGLAGAGAQTQAQTPATTEQNSPAVNNLNAQPEGSNNVENSLLDMGGDNNQTPAEDTYGETVVGGMKVTLLNLKDSEKEAVQAKLEQIRPTYLRIDALIASLLHNGGNVEFDKVRKLTGMKQMIGIQLDVINQGIYFIRPETLQQLLPSLNQYFSYAEMLVNSGRNGPPGRGPAPQGNVPQQQRINMTASSPMLHPNVINAQNQQSQQFARTGTASPLMAQNPIGGSPNIRPNMMGNQSMTAMSPQTRPMALPQQVQQQPQYIQQQMNIVQSKIIHIQQQLQQLHQMSLGPIPPEQMMNLQMRQQELLKSQQLLSQQLNSLSQMQQQSMLQVQRGQAVRPPGGVDPNYLAQMQMMQQNPQMQQNPRLINPQGMPHRQSPHMHANQMAFQQGLRPPQSQQQMQQMQQMQQQQMQQMQQMRNQVQTPNSVPNVPLSDFQGSPKLALGNMQQPSAASPENPPSAVKSEPNTPKEATPRIPPNQPTPQPVAAKPEGSPVQQSGQISQPNQSVLQQRQSGIPAGMPLGMQQQGQMQITPEMQQAQAMMLQGIGIRPPAPGQMNITPEQMQQLMQMASHQQQMGMPGHMIRQRLNGSMQAQHAQNANLQNRQQQFQLQQQQQQFHSPQNSGPFAQQPQKANSQPGTPDFQQQQQQHQLHQQQQIQQQQQLQLQMGGDQHLRTGLNDFQDQVDDPFNIGAEPASAGVNDEEKDEMPMEEFFNFDSFDNQNAADEEEDLFNFNAEPADKISPGATSKGAEEESPKKKRSRDDEDEHPVEKKKKVVDLAEELGILAKLHPFTFDLKDTPNEGVNISCSVNSVSFTLSIHNRKQYETSASTITFQTTQKPDSLSSLITDQLKPGSESRISDIVEILVEHLKDP